MSTSEAADTATTAEPATAEQAAAEPATAAGPVEITVRDGVLRILLNQPARRNALDMAAVGVLVDALDAASTDDTLRAVVLEGAGGHFCSGANWVSSNTGAKDDGANGAEAPKPRTKPRPGSVQRRTPVQAHRLVQLLMEIQLPVVCVVRGWAAGLGFQLALAADVTVAADDARFWEPFLERGFTPDSGATWLLPRLVGIARARDLLLLGRKLTGAEAAAWGLIHASAPAEELDALAAGIIEQLATGPTVAIGLAKRSINRNLENSFAQALENEALALELSSRTADFREGLAAFTTRRPPSYTGR
ncbi:enoyl-CoA hydratase/isomerase family protein [Frankia sp. CNm7]|uniref:Enoyl-CoA hydratase/isomerase family protein n=1 Tax=Frankia nepalensis TaxID=1836974 RepID=A0A937RG96_9ACTN|nr:enoyl-CoA hydratase-related protein [Frankia nepalensis]MBL7495812.1 enoyl-CoA hydratase/isomerase family protein [Frankia nepalensis]MBL7509888.1 enoyl-CoA hydratase/isomerase family protein [Frankia nepalensis]MBL7517645.1 enoyl-CoA hydratase/isomerase family protein [Frankia nepalensis]MBL7629647.1 enoyl-CoA hydratase/isomerase family protein [Frankia nepalensis]